MAEYEDGPITYVEEEDHGKRLVDQLKNYLENTPKEQLERDFFEIRCKCEGIDPNDENAKRNIEARIHITNYNIFEAIDRIAMTEEEAANAYLSVLAQITAKEMETREILPMG